MPRSSKARPPSGSGSKSATVSRSASGREERLLLVGILKPADAAAREALANLALVDIATAQEILDLPGRLTRIDLALPEGEAGERARREITALLPPGVHLARASARPKRSSR